MAVLHGSWLPKRQRFLLWGEVWRRTSPADYDITEVSGAEAVFAYPFCLQQDELIALLKSPALDLGWATARLSSRWKPYVLPLPAQVTATQVLPQHSQADAADSSLYPWQVEGLLLPPEAALKLLNSLPLGTTDDAAIVGADLRYWSHAARWCLDLLARGKFIPQVSANKAGAIAPWHLLLDSATDQTRLRQFGEQMPLTSQLYPAETLSTAAPNSPLQVPLPAPPKKRLRSFLEALVDARVRTTLQTMPLPASAPLSKDLPLREWLTALSVGKNPQFEATPAGLVRLNEALNTWTAPLQELEDTPNQLRTCFVLTPPPSGKLDWTLHYGLEAADDEQFRLDAATIWAHPVDHFESGGRMVEAPQETLLGGLGRAARLYEPIKQSLHEQSPQSCQLDPVQAYEFIKITAWRLMDNGFSVVLPPNLADPNEANGSRLGLRVQATAPTRSQQRLGLQSLLNFRWELSIGGQSVTKADFDELVAQQTPLVEINGQWVELRPQDIRAVQDFFKNRKEQNKLSIEDVLRISTGDNQLIDKLPVVDFQATGKLKELITTLTTGNQSLDAIEEPAAFEGTLRPYQARGVSWLSFLEQWGLGACLADDMGLGKTVQLIAFLLYLDQEGALKAPVLLVCPTSVLTNWEREVRRFGPTLKTLVYHGDKRPRGANFTRSVKLVNLLITSYTLVHRDLKDLKRVQWQGIVLDEAQNIKNPDAKQSQAVKELDADLRIALTGTPVENRLGELWSIMDFLNPNYLGPKNFFQRRFATPIERYGDTASLKTLRGLVQPFILRRLKTDRSIIQDLPEKQEMTVFCGLSAEQARLYQKTVDEALATIDEAEGVQRRGLILGLLVKLKQICNHPAQFLKQKSLGKPRRSAKLQRLNEMLEEVILEGDRALIFTQFAEWGKLLKRHLEAVTAEETLFLYGSTSKQGREEMVDRFQLDPNGPKVFILSLKAGGVGLNLTRANHVFHFDRWWNPAVENQATDRAFRIGQTRNVQVHKFVCSGTLEERINDMIESKKALAEQVVGAGEQWLTELDTEQLRDLLLLDRKAVIDES
ncbi:MAG: DEAD/DEAH box helicase [Leptolyngbya sp. SIO4C1]|nr:DEAD/DEAH box helicase [Leptolyngbya sp. SIO4C1]